MKRGFTLIEVIVGVTVFIIVALGVYEGYRAIHSSLASAHLKIVVASLVNEQFEVARNLPYASLSTLPSNQTLVRDGITFGVETILQDVDDYKLMEVGVSCVTCKNFSPVAVTGHIAPKDLTP